MSRPRPPPPAGKITVMRVSIIGFRDSVSKMCDPDKWFSERGDSGYPVSETCVQKFSGFGFLGDVAFSLWRGNLVRSIRVLVPVPVESALVLVWFSSVS